MKSLIVFMEKLKFGLDKVISWMLIIILGIMTILVTYQVIVRYIFDSPSAISEVLSRYLFVWLVMLGSAYVFGLKEHMAISFIKEKFSNTVQILADMFIELIIASFALFIMILGGYNSASRQMFQTDSALQIPMGIIYAVIPISGGLILFYFIFNEIKLFHKLCNLNQEKAEGEL